MKNSTQYFIQVDGLPGGNSRCIRLGKGLDAQGLNVLGALSYFLPDKVRVSYREETLRVIK